MGDDEANMETIERAFNGCATCGHPYASHTRTDGGCGVIMVPKYRCSCTQYAAPVAVPDELTTLREGIRQIAALNEARAQMLADEAGDESVDTEIFVLKSDAAALRSLLGDV